LTSQGIQFEAFHGRLSKLKLSGKFELEDSLANPSMDGLSVSFLDVVINAEKSDFVNETDSWSLAKGVTLPGVNFLNLRQNQQTKLWSFSFEFEVRLTVDNFDAVPFVLTMGDNEGEGVGYLIRRHSKMGKSQSIRYMLESFEQSVPDLIPILPEGVLKVHGVDTSTFNPSLVDIYYTLDDEAIFDVESYADMFSVTVGNSSFAMQYDNVSNTIYVDNIELPSLFNTIVFRGSDSLYRDLLLYTTVVAGHNTLEVVLVDEFDEPILELADVQISLGEDDTVMSSAVVNHTHTFHHMPQATMFISAKTRSNRTAVLGVSGIEQSVQLVFEEIPAPSNISNNDFSLGMKVWDDNTT
jgi:hypothetical protein